MMSVQPPPRGPEAPEAVVLAEAEPYRPLSGLASAIRILLIVLVVVDVVAVVSGAFEYSLLQRAPDITFSEANANDARQAIVGVLQLLVYVATTVVFIIWFHRAYKNLWSLGARGTRYGTGWAIGSWFVPILNLFRPKQIANDVWRASAPDAPRDQGESWRGGPLPALYLLWWIAWLISGVLGNLAIRSVFGGDGIDELRATTLAFIASDGFDVIAAVLALLVVTRTTARQEERAARLSAG